MAREEEEEEWERVYLGVVGQDREGLERGEERRELRGEREREWWREEGERGKESEREMRGEGAAEWVKRAMTRTVLPDESLTELLLDMCLTSATPIPYLEAIPAAAGPTSPLLPQIYTQLRHTLSLNRSLLLPILSCLSSFSLPRVYEDAVRDLSLSALSLSPEEELPALVRCVCYERGQIADDTCVLFSEESER